MIFAAGMGKRMAPLTLTRPKPLIEVAGRTLLDHALVYSKGFGRVVVNTHYLADQIAAHLGSDIAIIHEPELLETGGGLKNALPLLGADPVATLNSDAVWTGGDPMTEMLDAWDPNRMEALLLLIPLERAYGHVGGDFSLDEAGRISRGGALIYSGLQITRTERLADWPERVFSMNAVWDGMIRDGTLFGWVFSGAWCDVGRPEGIAEAEAMLRNAGYVRP